MSVHRIHIFISHSWTYSDHYLKLWEWIFQGNWRYGQASVRFSDYSVPEDDPIDNAPTDRELREAIYRKIERSHVVIIPTGMYVNYSKWIRKEIAGSRAKSKPILGVNPWGQKRASSVVSAAATKLVHWNKTSVVNGIWELYRH